MAIKVAEASLMNALKTDAHSDMSMCPPWYEIILWIYPKDSCFLDLMQSLGLKKISLIPLDSKRWCDTQTSIKYRHSYPGFLDTFYRHL
jgi:hypothetical protein